MRVTSGPPYGRWRLFASTEKKAKGLCSRQKLWLLTSAHSGTLSPMRSFSVYVLAAIAEIAGCYSVWAFLKLGKPVWWLVPGVVSLCLFAWLLTLIDSPAAGRAYATYGAIYIAASIGWMWLVEKQRPDLWDAGGLALCLIGSAVILFAPRVA